MPSGPVEASVEALRAAWRDIVGAVRARSRFLGEALAATQPTALTEPWLTVTLGEPNQLFAERLQQQAGTIEEILSQYTGRPLRLRVTEAAVPDGEPVRPKMPSDAKLKADRLKDFRAKDPSLDAAVAELDLEIAD